MRAIVSVFFLLFACAAVGQTPYQLVVEQHATNIVPGQTTYRLYIKMQNSTDFLSSLYGNNTAPWTLNTSTNAFYNDQFATGATAGGVNLAFTAFFPTLAADSWVTIGIASAPSGSQVDPSTIEDSTQPWKSKFTSGASGAGTNVTVNSLTGGAWYVLNGAPNAVPPANSGNKVLCMQITTAGTISGRINAQIFPLGVGANQLQKSFEFSGTGTFNSMGATAVPGCTNSTACNFNSAANQDNGFCVYATGCDTCLGGAVVDGDADNDGVCNANEIAGCTSTTACNYNASATDNNGSCVFATGCDFCSGGAVADGDADNDGVCNANEVSGCTNSAACNYNASATENNGSCVFATGCDFCSGGTVADGDTDNDGVCNANEIVGCQTAGACNYNAAATDAGSCVFATGCDSCSGGAVVDGDTDNDGVCNANEVAGCTNAAACNYNASATDNNGSCVVPTGCDFCSGGAVADGDTDNDGVCNANEVAGCTDSTACNYNANATDNNGSCDYCSCAGNGGPAAPTYSLTVEQHATGLIPGQTTYRFYVNMLNPTDFLSSIYGNNNAPLMMNTSTNSFYNDQFVTGATAGGVNLAFAGIFPSVLADSWVTIGISSAPTSGQADPSTIESSTQPWKSKFTSGAMGAGTNVLVNDVTGGAWYLLNGTSNGLPSAVTSRVLVMQMTTAGTVSGRINAQIFPLGVGANQQSYSFEFSGTGTFNPIGYTPGGSGSSANCGCMDATACNYDASATTDNGSCIVPTGCDACAGGAIVEGDADNDDICDIVDACVGVLDSCGICNGPGAIYTCGCTSIPAGDCDCDGNTLDALGVCGGACAADTDNDSVCDDVDACVGAVDACGICNGPGAIYACGCTEVPTGECDCTGLCVEGDYEGDGVFEADEVAGCTSISATNYNPLATNNDGSCEWNPDVFQGLVYEVMSGSIAGFTTYRVYAEFSDEAEVIALFGGTAPNGAAAPWSMQANGGAFYQNLLAGGGVANVISPVLYSFFPGLEYDSWFTIGAVPGESSDLATSFMGGSSGALAQWNTTGAFSTLSGALFVTPGSYLNQGATDSNGRVLLGQFTTDGIGYGRFNLQYLDGSGTAHLVQGAEIIFPSINPGCQDPLSSNYEPEANFADNSLCAVSGCTDSEACNFEPEATVEDGSCTYIPASDCDCNGNVIDALGVCGGVCTADANDNGVCDEEEGCTSSLACNYDAEASYDDGSCDFCSCAGTGNAGTAGYSLTVEPFAINGIAGMTTYRMYVNVAQQTDFVSAMFGNDVHPLQLTTSTGSFYNSPFISGPTPAAINPALVAYFPQMAFDSWATIGLSSQPVAGQMAPYLVESVTQPWQAKFIHGSPLAGSNVLVNDSMGGVWFVLNGAPNGYPPAGSSRVLVLQMTTAGTLSGVVNAQIFPNGNGNAQTLITFPFSGVGTFAPAVPESALSGCGCTDPVACNYDAGAAHDNNTCIYPTGCDFCSGGAIADGDTNDNGICDVDDLVGCSVVPACNYEPDRTVTDDSLCVFAVGCDTCSNGDVVDGDADDDGTCDAIEVPGCTLVSACNYDPAATETDGSCEFTSCFGCMDALACNFNPTATSGSSSLCTYPPSSYYTCSGACAADVDSDGVCDAFEAPGCTDGSAANFLPWATDDDGTCIYEVAGCSLPFACNYNPAATVLNLASCVFPPCMGGMLAAMPSPVCDQPFACNYGQQGPCDFVSCLSLGCTEATACNFDPDADYNDGSCDYLSCLVPGCTLSGACNYTPAATSNDGSCEFLSCVGCTDASADNYDPLATLNAGCIFGGCVQPSACNYDPSANTDDGTCDFVSCSGCMNAAACNYDPTATVNDAAACVLPTAGYGCDGLCLDDTDNDGVCDPFETPGCTNPLACNYVAGTLVDNGSCDVPVGCEVCIGGAAVEADADGDGVCDASDACSNPAACNYIGAGGTGCLFLDACGDCGGDGVDTDLDGVCDFEEIEGCTDFYACNFNFEATDEDGSCDQCSCPEDEANLLNYALHTEVVAVHTAGELAGKTTYRLYLQTNNANDIVTSVTGNAAWPLELSTSTSFWQSPYGSHTAEGQQPILLGLLPTLQYDSYITLGLTGPASAGQIQPTILPGPWVATFESGGNIVANSPAGSGWYATPGATNLVIGPTRRMLIAQLTTDGELSGSFTSQVFPNGAYGFGIPDARVNISFGPPTGCGCMDCTACNYDPAALHDDGSCTFEIPGYTCDGACLLDADSDGVCDQNEITGCLDATACNFSATATDAGYCEFPATHYDCSGDCLADSDGDGVCNALEVPGCTAPTACNFSAAATDENGSCVYAASGYACNGACLIDSDSDGVCDQNEVTGCLNPAACNYSATATDAGYCDYPAAHYDCDGDCLADSDGDGVCDALEIAGCTTPSACNFNPAATDNNGSCVYAASGYTCGGACLIDSDADGVCDQNEVTGCLDSAACNYAATATDSGYCDYPATHYDCSGDCLADSDGDGVCDALEITGCTAPSACNFNPAATDDNGSCTYAVDGYACSGECLFDSDSDGVCDQWEVTGCLDSAACNYAATATDAGYCDYPATHYDCNGNCLQDTDGDGVCNPLEVPGCTAPSACNFNPAATDNNGSCTYAASGYACNGTCLIDSDSDGICDQNEVTGCLNPAACNYAATATDAGYCDYPATHYDCNGNCLQDTDGDGVCDPLEIPGCTIPFACNFNAAATNDNGSCTFAVTGYTCAGFCLLDADSDGVCDQNEITGCLDATACNYTALATDAGYCDYPPTHYTCAGGCLQDSDGDGVCNAFEVPGCTAPSACNFNAAATDDNGSCTFALSGYACNGSCLIDSDSDGICDQNEITGCLDSAACNYLATATDAGYCDYPPTHYTCTGACLFDADGDGVCDAFEIPGCTDPTAVNFHPWITESTAICLYESDFASNDCPEDLSGDGVVGTSDLLMLLSSYNMWCPD